MKMARFRRGQNLRPIISNKEIVDSTLLGVAAATVSTVTVASTINDYVGTVGTCPLGSKIMSVYVFVQGLPTAGTANFDWFLMKSPGTVGLPVPGAVGGSTSRKYVLHEEKGIPGNAYLSIKLWHF